jgi:hypothetical protein
MLTDPEIKLLLQIVTNDHQEMPLSPINISRLIRLAVRHKVVYQLLRFAQQYPPLFTPDQLLKLENRSRHNAQRSLTQLSEMKTIAGSFNEKGIGYVCIKGPQLARMIYGREALKESVDLDIILVDNNNLSRVHVLLSELGYTRSNLNQYPGAWRRKIFLTAKREVHYFNQQNKCSIDLHIRPGANTYITEKRFKGFLSRLKAFDLEGKSIPVLPDEAYFVYLCYHGALHQFSRLAWLLDIRAFMQIKSAKLDFSQVSFIARSLQLERCVYLAFVLLKDYFGEEPVGKNDNMPARMRFLAASCHRMLDREPQYGLSLRGRIDKFIYIMVLLKGLAAKIDWIYGIIMRQLIRIIAV